MITLASCTGTILLTKHNLLHVTLRWRPLAKANTIAAAAPAIFTSKLGQTDLP